MTIELNAAQAAVVESLLSNRLANLSSEIRHTDSPQYRVDLRNERELLREVLGLLQTQAA